LVKKTPLSFGKKDQRFGKVHPSLGKKDQRFGIKVTPVFLKSTPLHCLWVKKTSTLLLKVPPLLSSAGKKDQRFGIKVHPSLGKKVPLFLCLLVKKTSTLLDESPPLSLVKKTQNKPKN
jgi:hypothetical protein